MTLAACAAIQPRKAEEIVQERAQKRWDALVGGNVPAAYAYLSPGSRSVLSPEAYESSIRKGFWKSAKVDRVQCGSEDACDVSASIEYEFRGTKVKSSVAETWVRQDGAWWYVQK